MGTIEFKSGNKNIEDTREIFREYSTKVKGAEVCFISFEKELADLEEIYAGPKGMLKLACDGDILVGCVGLKPIANGSCELKRLYVKEGTRNKGVGRSLVSICIDYAKKQNYKKIVLETMPGIMDNAIRLYLSSGFIKVEETCGILKMEIEL